MPYKIKPVITKEEYDKLLDYCNKSKTKNKKQYLIAMVLGFEAGMRISEIVGLKAKTHKIDGGLLHEQIIEQGGKKVKRLFCQTCNQEVGLKDMRRSMEHWDIPKLDVSQIDFERNYILIKQGKGRKDRIVPIPKSLNRTAIKYLPLAISRDAIGWYIKKIAKKVLEKDISFHTLRAGFATHLLDNNMPIHQVQLLMGHSRIDTTGVYARASPKNAVENARELF